MATTSRASRSHIGRVDLVRRVLELDVARRARGEGGRVIPGQTGVRDYSTAERAVDHEGQVVEVRGVWRVLQDAEPEVPYGTDGLAGRHGDGMVELDLGHVVLLSV